MAQLWKVTIRKVCGVTRPADAKHAVRAGANAIGMVFYRRSPRAVSVEQARLVSAQVPDGVRKVAVFVNEQPDRIAGTLRRIGANVVQLHGDETPEQCHAVRRSIGANAELWKATRVGDGFDGTSLAAFPVDAFLLDTSKRGSYGGTGETFPWHLAIQAKPLGRVVLAGGLDGSNVADAVRSVRPWGVDASSLLERRPGVKDARKVSNYLEGLRRS